MGRLSTLLAGALLAASLGCETTGAGDQAIAVLIDVSGTYADETRETVKVIKREILPSLVPGDTLLIVRIDSESYDEENVEALLTLDRRPSRANAQKLALARRLDAFADKASPSIHTDIPGAIMLASEYLNEIEAGSRVVLIFSDLETDLPAGATRELGPEELTGTHVVAMNVKRLRRDTADPAQFRGRLDEWSRRVEAAGASEWRSLMDEARLPDYLASLR